MMKIKKSDLIRLIKEAFKEEDYESLMTASNPKKEFRKQSLRHHPDRGGSTEDFQMLAALYDAIEKGLPEPSYEELVSMIRGDEEESDDDANYQSQQQGQYQQYQRSSGPRNWRDIGNAQEFVNYFSKFRVDDNLRDDFFNATNDDELINSYGAILRIYYGNRGISIQDTFKTFLNTVAIVDTSDVLNMTKYDENYISNLDYDGSFVRDKFRSMMFAKRASMIPPNKKSIHNIIGHAKISFEILDRVFSGGNRRLSAEKASILEDIKGATLAGEKQAAQAGLNRLAQIETVGLSQYSLYSEILMAIQNT